MSSTAKIFAWKGADVRLYPPPLASHEDVVKDTTRFWDTLRRFHSDLGTKYMVPVIGGKELDLHLLYVEVVSEKKWREIGCVFNFSPTTTMKVGSEMLNGVLYYPDQPKDSSMSTIQPCTAIVPYTTNPSGRRRRRRRRGGDPNRPKTNTSGYNFFFAEKHSALKSICPDREREFTKMIGESWNNLGAEERRVYQSYGVKDKERYQRELKEYKERLNFGQQPEVMRMGYYAQEG